LRFAAILSDLGLPALDQHDAFNDALMTAMMYVQLRDMLDRGSALGASVESITTRSSGLEAARVRSG
jgi:hypothetical protein